jgi:hypothetical protein
MGAAEGGSEGSEPLYATSSFGLSVRVFSDRVEYKKPLGLDIIPVSQIASVGVGSFLLNRLVIETTGGRKYVIATSRKKEVAEAIYRAQASLHAPSRTAPIASVADELTKLARLREQGILSNEEFERQKASVLGGPPSHLIAIAPPRRSTPMLVRAAPETTSARRAMKRERSPLSKVARGFGIFLATVLGLFVVAVLVVAAATPSKHKGKGNSDTAGLTKSQLLDAITAKVSDGTLMKRGSLEVNEFSDDEVSLRYTFKAPPPRLTRNEAEVVTVGLVVVAIQVLMEHGYDAKAKSAFVSAHAYQPTTKSVTGRGQVLTFGWASYDFNKDKVEFNPAEQ